MYVSHIDISLRFSFSLPFPKLYDTGGEWEREITSDSTSGCSSPVKSNQAGLDLHLYLLDALLGPKGLNAIRMGNEVG